MKSFLFMRKSDYTSKLQRLKERRGDATQEDKLEYFRKLILDHLEKLEKEEGREPEAMKKAFDEMLIMAKGGRGLPVGTVREWKGKKFVKIAPGKWRPKYDSESRGAKMAVSAIRKKIAAAKDAQEMMQIILENRDRFSGPDGNPLPFVQELSKYVEAEQEKREAAGKKAKKDVARKPNGKIGDGKPLSALADAVHDKIDSVVGMGSKNQTKAIVRIAIETAKAGKTDKDFAKRIDRSDKAHVVYTPREAKRVYGIIVKAAEKAGMLKKPATSPQASKDGKVEGMDVGLGGTGGNPDGPPSAKQTAAAAISAKPPSRQGAETSASSLSASSEKESSENEENSEKKPAATLETIRAKYQSAKTIEGDEDEIQVGKEIISGRWKLVEAGTPTASHDERTFHKTQGYPANADGSTINDRDYEHDRDAQEIVVRIGGEFDGRAASVDNPVIVTNDGIVISGNNRTMSSKIAARQGTDTKYIETLKKKAKKFGFTPEQIGEFEHPRVVFETSENKGYSTDQFAKFNKSSKKAMSPLESAVKVAKTIKSETVETIAGKISEFETLGELYANGEATGRIFAALSAGGIVSEMDMPRYWTNGGITGAGKEFMETVLIGSVISETNIRGLNREGCKSIRQKLVRAITPLIENKGMGGYSITRELNEAVDIAMQVAIHKDKWKSVTEFSQQRSLLGETHDPVSLELAKKLEGTQKGFAEFMQTMNGGLKYAANGEADIFLGKTESREDILARMLNLEGLKKAIRNIVKSLTWSGHKLQGRTKFQGMDISIENRKGSTRSGVDKDGHEWKTFMHWPYGYIRGTVGKDKDHVDCYIGPNPESEKVFVVHQVDPYNGGVFDEDKVMLGWDDAESAKKAYLGQYDRPDYFGSIDVMDIDTFKEKAFDEANKGKMLKGSFFTESQLKREYELRNNVKFCRKVYEFFTGKNGEFNIYGNHYKLKDLEGFPKGLDLENCKILRIDTDSITFEAGGDWQQAVNFSVELRNGELKIVGLYNYRDRQNKRDILRLEKIIESVAKEAG